MAYQIKIHNFEGPFDLLFHLIEKSEMDIYDIPIAEITNQYLEYINEMQSMDLEVASEFIVMAATLLQIKSKMLLPKETNPLNEITADGDDPRAELVEKLLEYKKYKEASLLLKDREEVYSNIVYKNAEIIDDVDEDKLFINITLDDIVNAFSDVYKRYMENHSKPEDIEGQIIREEFTVDEKMDCIREFIKNNRKFYLKDLFLDNTSKIEIIITFLALLELIKLRQVRAYQNKTYGDIIVEDV